MKGKIIARLPQRIYEFLEVHYDFESKEERDLLLNQSIEDCGKFSGIIERMGNNTDAEEMVISGVKWFKTAEGKWKYDPESIRQ